MSSGIGLGDISGGNKWWGGAENDIGSSVTGVIISASREQQTDYDTGKPLEWDNGDPRMESVIVFQTELDELENDTGIREVHLRGGNFKASEGTGLAGEKALRAAMTASGVEARPGNIIKLSITGKGESTGRGRKPPKLWTIELSEKEQSISESDLDFDS